VVVAQELVLVRSLLQLLVVATLVLSFMKQVLAILNVAKSTVKLDLGLNGERALHLVVVALRLVLVRSSPNHLVVVIHVPSLQKLFLVILTVVK
jgi:hypothetical protein